MRIGINMENTDLIHLGRNLIESYKTKQDEEQFHRNVNGDYEPVKYLPGSSIRFWVNNEAVPYDVHWHPAIEMIIPLENGYTAIVGQEKHELKPGDIFIIPAGELHHLIAPSTGVRLIYLFDLSLLSRIRGFSYLTSYISQPILINEATCPAIYDKQFSTIIQLCKDYYSNDTLRELSVYSQLLDFFVVYGRHKMELDEYNCYTLANESKQKDLMDKLNTVFEYLDEYFAEDLTLEKVASVAGFSKFHFSRLFKQCSGYNFYEYLCFRRIKSAETLLLKPGISITEVALQSGFSSLSTFNRTFKKHKNCTPSEYRNLYSSQIHPFF